MFVTGSPAAPSPRRALYLDRAVRESFLGPAEFLADAGNLARVGEYLADMARPYALGVPADLPAGALGHSYGEMADTLICSAVRRDEPVDLLVLAFAVHDARPGRQTAAYLSHVTPGAPMAFAICDQGSAAAFTGLRIVSEYASSAGISRALVIVVEQAGLPYDCQAGLPSGNFGVAMLCSVGVGDGDGDGDGRGPRAALAGVRQHGGVEPGDAVGLAAAGLAELTAGHDDVALVLSDAAAAVWTPPGHCRVRAMPPGQPSTGVWWGLCDEVASGGDRPGVVVAADYDPGLRYLCLAAFDTSAAVS